MKLYSESYFDEFKNNYGVSIARVINSKSDVNIWNVHIDEITSHVFLKHALDKPDFPFGSVFVSTIEKLMLNSILPFYLFMGADAYSKFRKTVIVYYLPYTIFLISTEPKSNPFTIRIVEVNLNFDN